MPGPEVLAVGVRKGTVGRAIAVTVKTSAGGHVGHGEHLAVGVFVIAGIGVLVGLGLATGQGLVVPWQMQRPSGSHTGMQGPPGVIVRVGTGVGERKTGVAEAAGEGLHVGPPVGAGVGVEPPPEIDQTHCVGLGPGTEQESFQKRPCGSGPALAAKICVFQVLM